MTVSKAELSESMHRLHCSACATVTQTNSNSSFILDSFHYWCVTTVKKTKKLRELELEKPRAQSERLFNVYKSTISTSSF